DAGSHCPASIDYPDVAAPGVSQPVATYGSGQRGRRGDMTPVSVLLPTYNNARIIRPCLESVRWADEILVLDSFSTDGTLDICRGGGARILQDEYINSAKQKNWAIPQCTYEWILQIDSDEMLEPGLKEEIQALLPHTPPDVGGYRIPFKHHSLGQW